MTDDEFIKAMNLPSTFPPLSTPKDPRAPTKDEDPTNEAV